MTLLRALPLPTAQRLTGAGSPVESLRRAGFRARVIAGWLNVWDAAPLTPGARLAPRERADSEGLWRHIPRPEFAALNEQAERERDTARNEGLARYHRERREAREVGNG